MKSPRVKRGKGPKSKMTEATYRKKALPFLFQDFQGRCAYCLDPSEFRHSSLSQVDHFNCKLKIRKRHQYVNLMLACAACNLSKHDKPVINPLDKDQRLLNCTEENEFLGDIVERDDGQWEPQTKAALYHLEAIGLREPCHKQKRYARRVVANRILALCSTAFQYQASNPADVHNQLLSTIRDFLDHLDNFPPLITTMGVLSAKEWLRTKGVDPSFLVPKAAIPSL